MNLSGLKDREVLSRVSESARNEKKFTQEVLTYLAEVNQRRLHLTEGYSSLHDFCIRYLKYSEGEANRRVQAARALFKFEEVIRPALEKEEITLTGLCLLSAHLKEDNVVPLLEASKNQSTRNIEKVIAEHFPEKKKPKTWVVELDEELETLLAQAERQASEKSPQMLLKKLLREFTKEKKERQREVKKHTRYVPARLRRDVSERDTHQCSYVSPSGIRCNQTAKLQIDHIRPWAMGGSSTEKDNLRLLCRAHNLIKARVDFPAHPNIAQYARP